jgi:membrane protease YdiL (CAAX protease family)
MDQEIPPPLLKKPSGERELFAGLEPEIKFIRWLQWAFEGGQGLRAGWSMMFFGILVYLLLNLVGSLLFSFSFFVKQSGTRAFSAFLDEVIWLLAVAGAATLVALLEGRRNLLAFNLNGPRRLVHFFSGVAVGIAALSALVGAMAWGGWLHFGPAALSGERIFKHGVAWAAVFLLVGCVEEGIFRCYLQFTFTRGINFWWAAGIVGAVCLWLLLNHKGNGVWGIYAIALLGLFPCLMLHIRMTPRSGFWQAAWVTSTIFGYWHTHNSGENSIGIFAAALIGFVFCVSVRVTGSAWWAIGCHAAWDWTETFFYGTADSGMVAPGHFLTTTTSGNVLWSGGADGPEGSLLVMGVILLMLAALLVIYGRKKTVTATTTMAAG